MKIKIFFLMLLASLFFADYSFAVSRVPVGTPLQPIPQNTGPSYNQNVNSANSDYSKNQTLDQQQISQPLAPEPVPAQNSNPAIPTTNSIAPSTEPIGLYWILLIAGCLGLTGAIAWLYWRFRQ